MQIHTMSKFKDILMMSGEELNSEDNYLVFLNGMVLGIHSDPKTFVLQFRLLRR